MKSKYLGLQIDLSIIFPDFSVNSTPCEQVEATAGRVQKGSEKYQLSDQQIFLV
jgi:hypothetical protein